MTENYLNILAETIRANWDAPALTDFYLTEDGTAQDTSRGNHYTYGEMYAELCRVAELLTSLGLQKGDHIAVCGANSAHWVIAYLAIAKMQGVSVTVMHSLMPDEIARLVAFSDAKALFTDPDIWGELQILNRKSLIENQECDLSVVFSLSDWSILHSICSQSRRSTDGQPTVSYNVIATHSKENLLDELVNGNWTNGICLDDLAMICFTSGTSGKPKAIALSYRSISINNVNNATCDLIDKKNISRLSKKCPFIAILPFSHMYGLMDNLISHITRGSQVAIIMGSFMSQDLITLISITKPYGLAITPSIMTELAKQAHKEGTINAIKELDYIEIGGASLSLEEEQELRQIGIPYFMGYGASEMGPHITSKSTKDVPLGSCGDIVDKLECRISPAGEILVKGENVMLGYYKDPEATAAKIDADGWLHTGDKGHLDEDGYLYVEGRLEQDIIVLPNGENIRPDNIEALINALPEVSESIVLARDGKLVAIVVPSSESSESSETSETRASSPSFSLRRMIMRKVNPSLPLFSQLYDVEITDTPLARTEKKTLKRYLYK